MTRNCFVSSDLRSFSDANLVKILHSKTLYTARFDNAPLNSIISLREVVLFNKTVGLERKIIVGLSNIDDQGNGNLFLFHNHSPNNDLGDIPYRQVGIQLTVNKQGKEKSRKTPLDRKIYLTDGPMAVMVSEDNTVTVHCLSAVKADGSVPHLFLGKLESVQTVKSLIYNNEHFIAIRTMAEWKLCNSMQLYRHFVGDESPPALLQVPSVSYVDSDHLASIPGATPARIVTASNNGCVTIYDSDSSVLHMVELPLPLNFQVCKLAVVGHYPRASIAILSNSIDGEDVDGAKAVAPFALLFDAETMKLQQEVRGVVDMYCDRFLNDLEFHLLWMTATDTPGSVLSLLPTEMGLVFFRADGTERLYSPQNVVNTATINSTGKKKTNAVVAKTKGEKKAKSADKKTTAVTSITTTDTAAAGTIKTKKKMRRMDGMPKASALVSEQSVSNSSTNSSTLSKEAIDKEIAARDEAMRSATGGEYGIGKWQSRRGKGPPRSILSSLQEQIRVTAHRLALFQHDYRVKRTEIAALRGLLVQQLCNPASFAPDTLPNSPFTRFFDQWRRKLQHATPTSQQREYLVSEIYPLSNIPVGAETMQIMRESVIRAAQEHTSGGGSRPPAQILETHIPPHALRYSHAAHSPSAAPTPSDTRDVDVLETLCLPDIVSASFGVTLLLRIQNHSSLPVFDMRITCSLDSNGLPTPQLGKADAPPGTPNISKTIPVSLVCTSAVVAMADVGEEVWMTARVPLSPDLFAHRSMVTHKAYEGGQHRYPRNPMGIADITRSYMQDQRQAADTTPGAATAVSMDDNPHSIPFEGLLLRVGLIWKDVRGAVQVSSNTNTGTVYADKCRDIRRKLNRNRTRSCWEVRHGYFPSTSRGTLAAVAAINLEDMYLMRRPRVSVREDTQNRVKRASLVRSFGAFRLADIPSRCSDPGQWLRAVLIHWIRSVHSNSNVRLVSYLSSQEVEVVSARECHSVFDADKILKEATPIAVRLNQWRAADTSSGSISSLLVERMKGMPELGPYLSDWYNTITNRNSAVNQLLFESQFGGKQESDEMEQVRESSRVTGRLISAPAPVPCPSQVGTVATSLGSSLAYLNSHILRPHESFAVPIYDKDASLDGIKTAATYLLEEMKAISVAYRLQKQKINQHHSMLGTASLNVDQLKAKCGQVRSAGKKLFLVDEFFWRELAERQVKADVAVAGAFEMTKYL